MPFCWSPDSPISCFRETEPPVCCIWPLTKSQKHENYPSRHCLQLFKTHQRSFWQTPTQLRGQTLTGRAQFNPPPPPLTSKLLTSFPSEEPRNQGDFEPFVRLHNSVTVLLGVYSHAESPDKQHWLPLCILSAFSYSQWPQLYPLFAQRVTSLWSVGPRNSSTCCCRVFCVSVSFTP